MLYAARMTSDPTQLAIEATEALTAMALEALATLHGSHDDDAIEIDDAGIMHGAGVHYVPTVRTSKLATPGVEGERHVEAVTWHYTDTRNAGAVNLAKRIAKAGDSRSCHAWIDRAGIIAQSASFERGTWHAGSATAALFKRDTLGLSPVLWEMLTPAQRGKLRGFGANSFAAGIELENVGAVRLVPVGNGTSLWCGWPFRFDYRDKSGVLVKPAIVPADEVSARDATHGHHMFTLPQRDAAARVVGSLARRYGLTRAMCSLTHAMIDPTRREDPGPLWTGTHLPAILDAVFGLG